MLVGYMRVSKQDQNDDLQNDALLAAGCERIFTDKASGAKESRPGLDAVMEFMREGDILVVWRLDRLGRSLKHLIEMINKIHDRGIGFKSLQEAIDTTTAGGKLIFHIFGAIAEFERELNRERTKAGLVAARARGRHGGRPRALDENQVKMAKSLMDEKTHSIASICKVLGVSKATLYRCLEN